MKHRHISSAQEELRNRYDRYYEDTTNEDTASYWSFFKLRIVFSLILLILAFATTLSIPSKESSHVSEVIQSIRHRDPYTDKVIQTTKTLVHKKD